MGLGRSETAQKVLCLAHAARVDLDVVVVGGGVLSILGVVVRVLVPVVGVLAVVLKAFFLR